MSRVFSLAHLTAPFCTTVQAIQIAAEHGYAFVGLRLMPNGPGAPCQTLIGDAQAVKETQAALKDTGVGVFDLEIIRLGEAFELKDYRAMFEAGAALNAKAILVAGDDTIEARLSENYARLCEAMRPYKLTADLEFMPWTAIPNANAAVRIVQMAGNPSNAGVLVDALHVGRSSTTLEDIRAIPRALLHYAQICDASIQSASGQPFTTPELIHTARCERLPPGEGQIDLAGIFAALPADLPISVEVVHLERMQKTGASLWARQCLEASKRYF